jgi:hypothetical protein
MKIEKLGDRQNSHKTPNYKNPGLSLFLGGRPDWSSAFRPARSVQYRLVQCFWSCPIGPVSIGPVFLVHLS